jgi:hypothetical protein
VLYNEPQRNARRLFIEERYAFLSNHKNQQSLYLASFNNKADNSRDEEQRRMEAEEYERIDRLWGFSNYPQELPMCIIMPSYNNNARFRIEYALNSVFQQNYTNYFLVIINDKSTDGSDLTYRKYLDFWRPSKDNYVYVSNSERKTALGNIEAACRQYCSPDAIGLNLDGDDEFIGKNVLKTFNAAYQNLKAGVLYSNFYWHNQPTQTMIGFTSDYLQTEKDQNLYRARPNKFSHLRTFRI